MKHLERAKLLVAVAAVIAATLFSQSTAQALNFTMNPGEHYAWVVKINNDNWIITEDANRICIRSFHLGNPALTDDITIEGTSSWDYIHVQKTTANVPFCGTVFAVSPPTLNGHWIDLFGHGGDDLLSAAASVSSFAYGGVGNDTIFAAGGNMYGEGGSDILIATTTNDILYGGDGNDWFCLDQYHARASIAYGGNGTDNYCGLPSNWDVVEGNTCHNTCLP